MFEGNMNFKGILVDRKKFPFPSQELQKKSFYSVLYVGKKPSGSRLTRKFNLHIYLLCWLAAMDNQVVFSLD